MDYFVRKHSDYSVISLDLIQDGHTDYETFFTEIKNAIVTFSMVDSDTGLIKISKRKAEICVDNNNCQITYRLNPKDVNADGTYIGNFNIKFNSTQENLIIPIREDLRIHILK